MLGSGGRGSLHRDVLGTACNVVNWATGELHTVWSDGEQGCCVVALVAQAEAQ